MLPIFKIVVTFKQTNEYKREGGRKDICGRR